MHPARSTKHEAQSAHHSVCPWWIGYLLVTPLRRLYQNPRTILAPYVRPGMLVVETGPGMGFFTLDMARAVEPGGRVVAIDVQPRMLSALRRRARRARLAERVETRLVQGNLTGMESLDGKADFVLAFAVVHELPDASAFFQACARSLSPGDMSTRTRSRGLSTWHRQPGCARSTGLQFAAATRHCSRSRDRCCDHTDTKSQTDTTTPTAITK
jgi:SAM-dependent methyltransferase